MAAIEVSAPDTGQSGTGPNHNTSGAISVRIVGPTRSSHFAFPAQKRAKVPKTDDNEGTVIRSLIEEVRSGAAH
jgi:hypothetical protein